FKQKQDSLSQPPHVSNQGLLNQLQDEIIHLQQSARKLVTYAGMLPYRLTGDTNTKIVQLEMLMT
ncbi:hypothetical protein, partial [Salmonella sp. s51228]|uniref:hypothetical protein n=1 Tax=Salmonella sp. s51228 TaxID=3159652 RepID=UPI0039814579